GRLAYLLVILALCITAFGQEKYAEITGTATDPSGAAVPNVAVTATHLETTRPLRTVTGSDGTYVIRNVEPGHYKVSFEVQGFSRLEYSDVPVLVGKSVTVNGGLKILTSTQEVLVTEDAPLIDTTTTQIAHNVTAEEFNRM